MLRMLMSGVAALVLAAPGVGLAAYDPSPNAYDHQPAPGTLKEEARQETHAAKVEADHARRMARRAHRRADRAHAKALKAARAAAKAIHDRERQGGR